MILVCIGYMSPKYAMHGQFSVKSDVYSFVVLILKIIGGRKNSHFQELNYAEDLLSYAWKHWNEGTALELLDPALRDSSSRHEVIRCIHIGLLSVHEDSTERPTMQTTVIMLNSDSVTLPTPKEPAFFLHSGTDSYMLKTKDLLQSDQSTSRSIPLSVDKSSITGTKNIISCNNSHFCISEVMLRI
ncbi:Cysteine rich receptor like kinase [Quillaja saponaria]|uniref:Cysteine rich receptor like kinase n=1 Tax=Quillaja saponaria TaxID=32244 RepID=A0AAD7KWH0_QUISA|nr:Cysteine rich receptor like kinase [Quillaja saponaria]